MKDFTQFIPEEAVRAKHQFFTIDEVRARGQEKIFELQLKAALGQLSDDDARDYAQIPQNLNEKMQVTPLLLKELEKHLDKLFASIRIDVEFSNHFKQRLVDRASTLDANEVMRTFEKLLAQHKGRIKNQLDFKAVLKDISNNNNIPFAIDYDFDKDEFILTAVTVMNKKNFKTGDQRVLKVK